jgi:hypothetical protein
VQEKVGQSHLEFLRGFSIEKECCHRIVPLNLPRIPQAMETTSPHLMGVTGEHSSYYKYMKPRVSFYQCRSRHTIKGKELKMNKSTYRHLGNTIRLVSMAALILVFVLGSGQTGLTRRIS